MENFNGILTEEEKQEMLDYYKDKYELVLKQLGQFISELTITNDMTALVFLSECITAMLLYASAQIEMNLKEFDIVPRETIH